MAPTLRGLRRRSSNTVALQKIRLAARVARLNLDLRVDPQADLSANLIPAFWGRPGSTVTLHVGPGCRIEDGATLRLKGGCTVELGERTVVRTGAVLNVSGVLRTAGDNLISWNSVIHSACLVEIGRGAGMSEGVTIVDSTHYRTGPGDDGYARAIAKPVIVGAGSWLAAKSVVLAGVTIGDEVTLASLSMAARNIPSGALAAGSPARVLRERFDGLAPEEREGWVVIPPETW